MMRLFKILFSALLSVVLFQAAAVADTVTFQWTDAGTGAILSNWTTKTSAGNFSNKTFTISATSNTSNESTDCNSDPTCTYLTLPSLSATMSVSDVSLGATDYGAVQFTFSLGTHAFITLSGDTNPGAEGFGLDGANGTTLYTGPNGGSWGTAWNFPAGIPPVVGESAQVSNPGTQLNRGWGSQGTPISGTVGTAGCLQAFDTTTQYTNCIAQFGNSNTYYMDLTELTSILDTSETNLGVSTQSPCPIPSVSPTGGTCSYDWGSFSATNNGTGVPEPSSLVLLGMGLIGLSVIHFRVAARKKAAAVTAPRR